MKNKTAGFTLVEVMITFVVFMLIIGVIIGVLITGKASYYISSAHIDLQQDLRRGMDWVIDELRHAGSGSIINVPPDDAWYTTIAFRKPSGVVGGYVAWDLNTVQYALGGINNRQLLRIFAGEQWVLANNITSFQVRRTSSGPGVVEVQLQADKRAISGHLISDSLTCQLKLRN